MSIPIYQVWVNNQPMYSDIYMNWIQALNAFKYYKTIYRNVKIIDVTKETQ